MARGRAADALLERLEQEQARKRDLARKLDELSGATKAAWLVRLCGKF
jgi:hypothetical protein